jgi:hypothetical protein
MLSGLPINGVGFSTYWDMDAFLEDLRSGTLKDRFTLSESAWRDLIGKVNVDPVFAGEIMDSGVVLLMSADSGFELDGLLSLAEECRGSKTTNANAR